VLFETAYVCGARAAEVCGLHVEDLDLRLDDEHVRIHGKGGTVRTVLLDDRGYVALLKLYLARAGYTAGRGRSALPVCTRARASGRRLAPLAVTGFAASRPRNYPAGRLSARRRVGRLQDPDSYLHALFEP
jgi:integrase